MRALNEERRAGLVLRLREGLLLLLCSHNGVHVLCLML